MIPRLVLFSLAYITVHGFILQRSDADFSCSQIKDCNSCANYTIVSKIAGISTQCEWCVTDGSCRSSLLNLCSKDSRVPHPYNCPSKEKVDYDEELIREGITPLIAGTHINEDVDVVADMKTDLQHLLGSCYPDIEVLGAYTIYCDKTNLTTCFGYVAFVPQHNAITLVFRGTISTFQLIDEAISFFLHPKTPFHITGGVVDEYYSNAFHQLWDVGMEKALRSAVKRRKGAEVWAIGHSLGGGLASLAAAIVSHELPEVRHRLRLITYGQPRIGDIEFAKGHDKLVPNSLRIIHANDPIPSFPPKQTYFRGITGDGSFHHKHEIWYPSSMEKGSSWVVSRQAEDGNAALSSIQLNMFDHFKYFEVDLATWWKTGCSSPVTVSNKRKWG